jgi:UDP-2,4-diacetamido-2,4,6-trideoxy-beta-L-altropyranose hydrolase
MNIAIRVNASKQEGSGHFIRAFILAKSFKKKDVNIYFLSNNLHKNYTKLLSKNNLKYINLKNSKNEKKYEENDIRLTIKALKKINKPADLIILDSYMIGIKWEKKIIKFTKKLLVIDDLDRKHFCDIYVSPLKIPNNRNIKKKGCKCLFGIKYLITNCSKIKKKFNNKKEVLIYMGDADSKNLTLSILKIVSKKLFEKFNFNILIGNSNSKRLKIMKNFKNKKNITYYNFQPSLKEMLNKIDLAIVGGGSIIFNLIFAKIPTLVVCQNLSQYEILIKNKICNLKNLLSYRNYSLSYLENFLKRKMLQSKIYSHSIKFDLLGPKRILKNIK